MFNNTARHYHAIRRKRMKAARAKGTHSTTEWAALKGAVGSLCLACGSDGNGDGGIVRDHIVPIYQGGSDSIDNIQPLCGRCNCRKGPDSTDLRDAHKPGWRARFVELMGALHG